MLCSVCAALILPQIGVEVYGLGRTRRKESAADHSVPDRWRRRSLVLRLLAARRPGVNWRARAEVIEHHPLLTYGPLTPSASAFEAFAPYSLYRGYIKLEGVRSPLRAAWFPVYASIVSSGNLRPPPQLQHSVWVGANPYPKGTFTPSEAPSFVWRTNGLELSRLASPELVSRRTQHPGWPGRLQ
jgi:hypothetical protein